MMHTLFIDGHDSWWKNFLNHCSDLKANNRWKNIDVVEQELKKYGGIERYLPYRIDFSDEKDAVFFKLRWS